MARPAMNTPNYGAQAREAAMERAAQARADGQARGAEARAEGQARGAEARAEGQAIAAEARARAAEAREAREQGGLEQQRDLAFRLTGEDDFLGADQFYFTSFTALNGSGITGGAIIGFDDDTDTITVAVLAEGVEAGQTHIQHIHGFPDGTDAKTPTLALDTDRDAYIELAEGVPAYGPVLLNLKADAANGAGSNNGTAADGPLAGFPTAPGGKIAFVETYQLPKEMLGADPMLALREIVIHGRTVAEGEGAGTPGEVDGTGGYKVALPVASGELTEVMSAQQLRALSRASGFDSDWLAT